MISNILHLSDLHFGIEPSGKVNKISVARRKIVLGSLVEKIKSLDEEIYPDIVVISGDIGWKGKEEDYVEASKWITEKIIKELNIKKEKIVITPGNHDIDISQADTLERPKGSKDVDRHLSDENVVKYLQPFSSYIKFYNDLKIPKLKMVDDKYKIVGQTTIDNINFVVLNSSWYFRNAGIEDDLWLGLPHIDLLEEKSLIPKSSKKTDEVVVAVFHHPPYWLNETEVCCYEDRPGSIYKLAKQCDVILTGHTHSKMFEPNILYSSAYHFSGGATYLNEYYKNNFSIYQIDKYKKTIKRCGYEYEPTSDKWVRRNDVNKTYELVKHKEDFTHGIEQINTIERNHVDRLIALTLENEELVLEEFYQNINVNKSRNLKIAISELDYFRKDELANIFMELYVKNKLKKSSRSILLRQNVCYYLSIINIPQGNNFLKSTLQTEKNNFVRRSIHIGLATAETNYEILKEYFDELNKPLVSSINAGYHQCYYGDKLLVEGYEYSDTNSSNALSAILGHLGNENNKSTWVLDIFTLVYLIKRQSIFILTENQRFFIDKWIVNNKKTVIDDVFEKQYLNLTCLLNSIDQVNGFYFYYDECGSYHRLLSLDSKNELAKYYERHLFLNGTFSSSAALKGMPNRIKSDVEKDRVKAKKLINIIVESNCCKTEKLNLLDLGCGYGTIVTEWERSGLGKAKGVDISSWCNEFAKNIGYDHDNIVTGNVYNLDKLFKVVDQFDIISSFDFIEHLFDLDEIFLKINRLLKLGSFFIIYIPVIQNLTKATDLIEYKYFYPDHHIHLWGYALHSPAYNMLWSELMDRGVVNLAANLPTLPSGYIASQYRGSDYRLLNQSIKKFAT